jgi:PAS domain S-box-containing protein
MNGRNIAIVVVLNLILLVIVIAQLDFLTISAASLFDLMNPLRPLTLVLFGLVFVAIFGAYKNGLNGEKLTRQKYETSRSMLDNLPVGVYRSTAQGRIVEANRRFSQLLGFETLSEMKQVNISDLYVRKSDRESHLAKLREGTVFAEFELRRKDGQTVWVRDYPKPTLGADGNVEYLDGVIMETYGTEAIVRDIAEHRRLESMRNQFATSVTHELRTPLVSINGYLDYVLSEDPGASLKDLRPDLEIVKHNADRLLELTNDLLDIQRMESGRLQLKLETISFRDLLKHCIEEIQPMLEQKNQHLHLEIPTKHMPIRADQLRLSQALVNLLNNAVKFTPHGGNITIHVEEDDGEIQVAVHDTGIGIDRKDLDRVFEPFAAIVKPSYYKGTGLGLSLTKRLIEAHEGRIWANSPGKDRGATFTFILPKKRMVVEVHG